MHRLDRPFGTQRMVGRRGNRGGLSDQILPVVPAVKGIAGSAQSGQCAIRLGIGYGDRVADRRESGIEVDRILRK